MSISNSSSPKGNRSLWGQLKFHPSFIPAATDLQTTLPSKPFSLLTFTPSTLYFFPRAPCCFRANSIIKQRPSHWPAADRPRPPGQEAADGSPVDRAEGGLSPHPLPWRCRRGGDGWGGPWERADLRCMRSNMDTKLMIQSYSDVWWSRKGHTQKKAFSGYFSRVLPPNEPT